MSQGFGTPPQTPGGDALSNLVNASTNTTAAAGDVVFVDTTSGPVTITLPTTPAALSQVVVKKVNDDSGASAVTVVAHGSGLIDRASDYVITDFNGSATFQNLAADTWKVISEVGPLSALSGSADVTATIVADAGASQTLTAATTGDRAYDLTLTQTCALTLAGGSSGKSASLFVVVRQGGSGSYTVVWPTNVRWVNGAAPTLSTAFGHADAIQLVTLDAGTTWLGFLAGSNFRDSTILTDTFNRADSPSGLGTADSGQVWTSVTNNHRIVSGVALPASGLVRVTAESTIDSGVADATISYDLHLSSGTANVGFMVRRSGANYVMFAIAAGQSGSDGIYLIKEVSGQTTLQNASLPSGVALGATVAVQIILLGSSIIVKLNGTIRFNYDLVSDIATTPSLGTGTIIGLRTYVGDNGGDDGASMYDNLVVT